jgi:hypothetical protein
MHEIARRFRGPDGRGRVMVLDVAHSAAKFHVYLGNRASRHAYYLKPPPELTAKDLEQFLDEAGGETTLEFRYHTYPELETELKPILSQDPFAERHFGDNHTRLLQLEGERRIARERIAQLLDGLKEPFHPESFPDLYNYRLSTFKPATEKHRAELTLYRVDEDRDLLRKSERQFLIGIAEHGFASEIDIYRPTVQEVDPVLILSSTEATTALGHAFLKDLADYCQTEQFNETSEATRQKAQSEHKAPKTAPSRHRVPVAPRPEAPRLDERELAARIAQVIRELQPTMNALKKRRIEQHGPYITIQFPGVLGFGKGPSQDDLKELRAIFTVLFGDPTLGKGWNAHFHVDSATGELKIAPSYEANPAGGWQVLSRRINN